MNYTNTNNKIFRPVCACNEWASIRADLCTATKTSSAQVVTRLTTYNTRGAVQYLCRKGSH